MKVKELNLDTELPGKIRCDTAPLHTYMRLSVFSDLVIDLNVNRKLKARSQNLSYVFKIQVTAAFLTCAYIRNHVRMHVPLFVTVLRVIT